MWLMILICASNRIYTQHKWQQQIEETIEWVFEWCVYVYAQVSVQLTQHTLHVADRSFDAHLDIQDKTYNRVHQAQHSYENESEIMCVKCCCACVCVWRPTSGGVKAGRGPVWTSVPFTSRHYMYHTHNNHIWWWVKNCKQKCVWMYMHVCASMRGGVCDAIKVMRVGGQGVCVSWRTMCVNDALESSSDCHTHPVWDTNTYNTHNRYCKWE